MTISDGLILSRKTFYLNCKETYLFKRIGLQQQYNLFTNYLFYAYTGVNLSPAVEYTKCFIIQWNKMAWNYHVRYFASSLQCFDTVGWVTGRASDPQQPVTLIPQVLFHNRWKLEMWANAQPDGSPAEYRWRPLLNAAVWLTPTTRCRAVTLPRRKTRWNL